jgi:hypothetical protein
MHLYLKYQSPNTFGSRDIAHLKVFKKLGQSSRSQGQKSWYQKIGLFIIHLYLKYQSSSTFGSKYIAQVKSFSKLGQSSRSGSQGQKSWYQKKSPYIMHLYLKYQSPNSFGKRDGAQVFQNYVKVQDQGHKVKSLGTKRKASS